MLYAGMCFAQVGVYGEDLPKEMDSFPTLLTSRPLKGSTLVNVMQDEGIDGGVADGRGLTLADSIAPHWFTPPEGDARLEYSNYKYVFCSFRLCVNVWSGVPQADSGRSVE